MPKWAVELILDAAALAGLALLTVGLWWLSPGVALAVLGLLLLMAGVVGFVRRG